jgi:hypothetical protein
MFNEASAEHDGGEASAVNSIVVWRVPRSMARATTKTTAAAGPVHDPSTRSFSRGSCRVFGPDHDWGACGRVPYTHTHTRYT